MNGGVYGRKRGKKKKKKEKKIKSKSEGRLEDPLVFVRYPWRSVCTRYERIFEKWNKDRNGASRRVKYTWDELVVR